MRSTSDKKRSLGADFGHSLSSYFYLQEYCMHCLTSRHKIAWYQYVVFVDCRYTKF
jgi:hypothetical protein